MRRTHPRIQILSLGRLSRTAAVLTLGLAFPFAAHAQESVNVNSIVPNTPLQIAIVQAITRLQSAQSTGMQNEAASIENNLQYLSGQLTSNNQATVNGSGNIATLQDSRAVQMRIEQSTYDAENQAYSGTSACNVITGALAGESLDAAMSQYNEQATEAQLAWNSGGSSTNPAPSYNGATAAEQDVISNHCKTSATQADIDSGLCPSGTAIETTDGTGGTEQVTVPQDTIAGASLISDQNSVISTQEQSAMPGFMALAFGDPEGAMPKGSATTQSGEETAYSRLVNQAQASIAYAAFNSVAGRNTPLQNSATEQTGDMTSGGSVSSSPVSLSSWANGTMAQIADSAAPSGGWFPNGVSFDAWLQVRALGWFKNPNWATALNSYSEVSAIKDLAMIEAYRAYLQFLQYRDGETTNMLLAQDTVLLERLANR